MPARTKDMLTHHEKPELAKPQPRQGQMEIARHGPEAIPQSRGPQHALFSHAGVESGRAKGKCREEARSLAKSRFSGTTEQNCRSLP